MLDLISITMFLFLWTFLLAVLLSVRCFNIDVLYPVIYENPERTQTRTYFGYSLALYGDPENGEKWIKVGAPKATFSNVNHSGVVYHCPFLGKCHTMEELEYDSNNMEFSWTGGAMDISYDYKKLGISASLWNKISKKSATMRGAIFIKEIGNDADDNLYSPLQHPEIVNQMPFYARSLTGFSIHFVKGQSELLVGAPGFYNYLGTAFRVKNIDKSMQYWTYEVLAPQGFYYEYSGYAVTSGYFHNKKQLHYVTGLPKALVGNEMVPYGSVIVFGFTSTYNGRVVVENQVNIKVIRRLSGMHFGEYFGSSLAAGDLNKDGLDDLIVGAPFRCNDKSGFNHGSVYIYYGNYKKLEYHPKNRIDGVVSGGQFGSALMVLGDLDNDGLNELAISAPNEESTGAIYIYTFDSVMQKLNLHQKISGSQLFPNLKGFGTSISRSTDIDDNNFLDFAVGSAISGHAVILRTKPTVFVQPTIKEAPSSISKSATFLTFKCCFFYTEFSNPNFTIIRNLTVDEEFHRFYFNNHVRRQYSEEKIVDIKQNRQRCELVNLTKAPGIKNYNDPITIKLTYKIPERQAESKPNPVIIGTDSKIFDPFCKNCPVLSKRSKKIETQQIIWDNNCDHNGFKEPCESRLEVEARFLDISENSFIMGSEEFLKLEVSVVNKQDPAYFPFLQISVPNGVSLRSRRGGCQNNVPNKISCNVGEVLSKNEKKVTFLLELNIDIHDGDEAFFFFNVSTVTENIDERSTFDLILKLKRVFSIDITGFSNESSYLYEKPKTTLIQNIFKVGKSGPSPTPPVEIEISVPYKITSFNGESVQFAKFYERNFLDNYLMKCNETTTENSQGLTQVDQKKDHTFKDLYLECGMENIICASLKCIVGPFENSEKLEEILIDVEVDFKDIESVMGEGWLTQIDQIILITDSYVLNDNFAANNESRFDQLTNVISIYKSFEISLWIIIGSAIGGLIILICISVCLAKAGFFERKKHKIVQQLKEEELEEERLMDEMIQKEMETDGEPFQAGDPVFRYISPKDLEVYLRKSQHDPLQNLPLLETDTNELMVNNDIYSDVTTQENQNTDELIVHNDIYSNKNN